MLFNTTHTFHITLQPYPSPFMSLYTIYTQVPFILSHIINAIAHYITMYCTIFTKLYNINPLITKYLHISSNIITYFHIITKCHGISILHHDISPNICILSSNIIINYDNTISYPYKFHNITIVTLSIVSYRTTYTYINAHINQYKFILHT